MSYYSDALHAGKWYTKKKRLLRDHSYVSPSNVNGHVKNLKSQPMLKGMAAGNLLPILKDGDHEVPNNNRPISLLPVLSKICERAAHEQLISDLTTNQRLTPEQCGNRKWNSAETSIIQPTAVILECIDKKQLATVVLLDMSKAFDSINHRILINKLQDVGLSLPVIK